MKRLPAILILFFLLFLCNLTATFEEHMSQLSGVAAKEHLRPFASSIGAEANTGWFMVTPSDTLLNFSIRAHWLVTYAGYNYSADESFDVTGSIRLTADLANEIIPDDITGEERLALINALTSRDFVVRAYGPTLYGYEQSDGGFLSGIHNGIRYVFPAQTVQYTMGDYLYSADIPQATLETEIGGYRRESFLNTDKFHAPIQMYQITIGTLAGTQAAFRFGEYYINRIGNSQTLGIGIQHNLAFWFQKHNNIGLTLLFGYQVNDIAGFIRTKNSVLGAVVSAKKGKGEKKRQMFMELTYETSRTDVKYDFPYMTLDTNEVLTVPVKFSLVGENKLRGTMGILWELGFFNIRLEATLAKYAGSSLAFGLFHEF